MKFDYFLSATDYEPDANKSFFQQRKEHLHHNYDALEKYCNKTHSTFPKLLNLELFHITLWRNLPKTNIVDNTEDTLFKTICEKIKQCDSDLRSLYIRDLETLANGSIDTFIQRFCLLKYHHNRKPIFLDNTTDSLFNYKNTQKPPLANAIHGIKRENEEYENLVGFLENLYITVKGSSLVQKKEGFIHYYFEWQKGNMLVKDILEKLGNMSKRTFYLYVNEFEAHPYYPEYCKLYLFDLIDKEKKGPLSINWQEYYDEINPFCSGKKLFIYEEIIDVDLNELFGDLWEPAEDDTNATATPNVKKTIDIVAFYKFAKDTYYIRQKYSIPTSLDAYRLWLTAKKKLKIKN